MKTLIFSDTHLSSRFDQAQFDVLSKQIIDADRVVINGDFFDQYLTTFEKFVNSDWNQLFPLLKQRQTIYILGNHDMRDHLDQRWQQFADRLEDRAEVRIGTQHYHIEHGHLHTYSFELIHPRVARLILKLYPFFDHMEHRGNLFSGYYLEFLREKHLANDRDLRRFAQEYLTDGHWYIFGHSHTQRKDEKIHYLNPGMFRYGLANWLTIDDRGFPEIHSAKY